MSSNSHGKSVSISITNNFTKQNLSWFGPPTTLFVQGIIITTGKQQFKSASVSKQLGTSAPGNNGSLGHHGTPSVSIRVPPLVTKTPIDSHVSIGVGFSAEPQSVSSMSFYCHCVMSLCVCVAIVPSGNKNSNSSMGPLSNHKVSIKTYQNILT